LSIEQSPAPPVTLEGPGRYHVYQAPNGDWVIARSAGICETCRGCGCGEQAEPVRIPAMIIRLAKTRGLNLGNLPGMLKAAGRG
jgi:hypothetical protein